MTPARTSSFVFLFSFPPVQVPSSSARRPPRPIATDPRRRPIRGSERAGLPHLVAGLLLPGRGADGRRPSADGRRGFRAGNGRRSLVIGLLFLVGLVKKIERPGENLVVQASTRAIYFPKRTPIFLVVSLQKYEQELQKQGLGGGSLKGEIHQGGSKVGVRAGNENWNDP